MHLFLTSFEDRQDLLGHKSDRMTTHYSAPELSQLLNAVNLICEKRPATVLRVVPHESGAKLGQEKWGNKTMTGKDHANALTLYKESAREFGCVTARSM